MDDSAELPSEKRYKRGGVGASEDEEQQDEEEEEEEEEEGEKKKEAGSSNENKEDDDENKEGKEEEIDEKYVFTSARIRKSLLNVFYAFCNICCLCFCSISEMLI